MVIRLAVLVITSTIAALFLTACDNFAGYTVINESDKQLITWPFFEDCGMVVGNKADYLHEEVIEPFERLHYHDVHGKPRDPKCVQVVTKDRRIVMAERYEDGGTYVVREPLEPRGDPIPERGDLPNRSFGEMIRETPPVALVAFGLQVMFALGFLVALLFALFITVRFLYRHYGGKL